MTFSERAIEAAAAHVLRELDDRGLLKGVDDDLFSEIGNDVAKAALTAATAVDGVTLVDQRALDWIFGEGPDRDGKWFGETIGDGVPKLAGKYPRTYWWRSKFRAMLSAARGGAEVRSLTDADVEKAMNDLARSVRNNAIEAAAKVARLYGAPEEACRRILMLRAATPPAGTEG